MKKYLLLLVLTPLFAFSQSPEKFTYQSIIRDSQSQLISNQNIGIQISILQGGASGSVAYSETHNVTTNINGLVTLEIGTGNSTVGDFSTINWENGPYFIKSELDITGSINYTISTATQLLSVPYSLYSKKAESARYLLDDYVQIGNDNATVNLQPNKKYFIDANNITLILPSSFDNFNQDNIEIYVMQHNANPRIMTVDYTNSYHFGVKDTNNDYVGFGVNQPTTITGSFASGFNKIIQIGDYWMCGSFTPQ